MHNKLGYLEHKNQRNRKNAIFYVLIAIHAMNLFTGKTASYEQTRNKKVKRYQYSYTLLYEFLLVIQTSKKIFYPTWEN